MIENCDVFLDVLWVKVNCCRPDVKKCEWWTNVTWVPEFKVITRSDKNYGRSWHSDIAPLNWRDDTVYGLRADSVVEEHPECFLDVD